MKALCILFGLYVCLTSGQRWNRYPDINPNFENQHVDINLGQNSNPYNNEKLGGIFSPYFLPPHLRPHSYNKLSYDQVNAEPLHPAINKNGNQVIDDKSLHTKETLSVISNPIDGNFVGNKVLHNNGVQNNLLYNGRRSFGDNSRGIKKINKIVYFVNKTDGNPFSQTSYSLSTNLPNQASVLASSGQGAQYWLNENNKDAYWIRPSPWNKPVPIGPVDINPYPFIPDNNNVNPFPFVPDNNNFNPYPFIPDNNDECYNLAGVINELRILVRKRNISEERYSLILLFRILNVFKLRNNIQHLPFNVIVGEIGRVLLNTNNYHSDLRENEISKVLQQFTQNELRAFLYEIRTHRETNLQVAVSKLALLLYKLKQTLIQMRFSQETITLVINRVVQWSVPLVGYYFEKECKIKTQKYILQNLEVALNVNLESIKNIGSIQELETEESFGNLGFGGLDGLENQGSLGGLGGLGNQGTLGGLGGLGSQGILGGLQNQGSLGGVGGLGNQGSLGGLDGLENQGNLGGLGGLGNQGVLGGIGGLGNQGSLGGLGGLGNQGGLVGLGELENQGSLEGLGNQGSLGGLSGLGNQGGLEGLGGLGNQGGLGGLGGLGNQGLGGLGGLGNQGLGGLGVLGNQGGLGGLDGLGNQGSQEGLGGLGNQENPSGLGSLENVGGLVSPPGHTYGVFPLNQGA